MYHISRLAFDTIKGNSIVLLGTPNDVDEIRVRKQLDTFPKYCTFAMYFSVPQNSLHDKVQKDNLSEASHIIKGFGEVFSYLDGADGVAQNRSA